MKASVTLKVRSYIADPYWPEQERLITIRKQSGVDRARSEEKRAKVLADFLKQRGIADAEYKTLVAAAERSWVRVDSANPSSPIVIPARQISGMLVHAANNAPAGCRVPQDNLRSLIQVTDFVTDRTKRDGVFSRFILPKDGKGNPLSNQRRYTEDEYIENFAAKGTITFDDSLKAEAVKGLLVYALGSIGVGACRKMDYGRGAVEEFKVA
jgi:hypothetical protein